MKRLFIPLWQGATYARGLYLLLGLPLGILYFTFLVTSLSLAVGLSIVWVGVPILIGALIAWRAMGRFERTLLSAMVGANIDPPLGKVEPSMSLGQKARALASDSYTWRSFGWLLLRFPLGIAGFVVVVVLVSTSLSLLGAPLALVWEDHIDFGWAEDFTAALWLAPLIGLFLAAGSAHVISGFARLHGVMARPLLGPSGEQERVALRRRTTVLEERTQLAHELHDSVGHTLTMMVVQAGAGRHVFDSDPSFSKQALGNIETSGRRALGELDHILGILREDDDSELAPQPTVGRVPDLVAEMTAAGVKVSLSVEGNVEQLPTEVSRSAYRIVQEALTNVLKHAVSAPAQVRLHRTAGALELEIVNEAPPGGEPQIRVEDDGGGRGIVGIRERVSMLGGSVEAGARPGGGFRVWVRLPVDTEEPL